MGGFSAVGGELKWAGSFVRDVVVKLADSSAPGAVVRFAGSSASGDVVRFVGSFVPGSDRLASVGSVGLGRLN